jgi:hypothetical protein
MDNQQKAGSPDKDKLNATEEVKLREWSDKLNVTKVQLRAAINAVGPSAKAVEAYLNRKK